jgi:alpha-tubulin suppressor-like RCC1 family protein
MKNTHILIYTIFISKSRNLFVTKSFVVCLVFLFFNLSYQQLFAQSLATGGGESYSSFAVSVNGTAYSWGSNVYGQLGNNTYSNSALALNISSHNAFDGKKILSISSGKNHTLALAEDGTVYAWGYGGEGQLGNGNTTSSAAPVQVSNLAGVTDIAAGIGFSLALKSDGTVYAWGSNWFGQLGNGNTTSSTVPVQVSNLAGVTDIAAGGYHALALTSNRTVYAWGSGEHGQLGNQYVYIMTTPVELVNLSGVTDIAAGGFHSLALTLDGTVYAWGRGHEGQLGNGSNSGSATPLQIMNLSNVKTIAAGGYHSLALNIDGTVYAWGYGEYGQLGNGNTTLSTVPVQVNNLAGVTDIAAGGFHSLALTLDGTVYAWGYGGEGQLGNNRFNFISRVPVPVSGLEGSVFCTQPNTVFDAQPLCVSVGNPTAFTDKSTFVAPNAVYEWDIDDDGVVDYDTKGSISHTYTKAGTYTAKLTIRQGACERSSRQKIEVKELVLSDVSVHISFAGVNTPLVSVSAPFTGDENNVSSAEWNWGDGNSSVVTKSVNALLSNKLINGFHAYAKPGLYTIKLLVTDGCGNVIVKEFKINITYDLTAVFVTGMAWVNSPRHSSYAFMQEAERAVCGFVAYQAKGSTTVAENTALMFLTKQMKFSSSIVDQIVITGNNRFSLRGKGKIINPATNEPDLRNFNFILSGIDGQYAGGTGSDRLRMRIWVANTDGTNGELVYDNLLGADDNIEKNASSVIGGGFIVLNNPFKVARKPAEIASVSKEEVELSVYPNPVRDKVTIDLKGMPAAGAKTILTNAFGKSILQNAHRVVGESLLEIDMTALQPGLYLIQLKTDTADKVIKVVKQ